MADLLLKVGTRGPDPDWQDGDIMCAFNQRSIHCCHAQHICHPRLAERDGGGLIVESALLRNWYEVTHQYRFERISNREIRRVNLLDQTEETLSNQPNAQGQAIDVPLFVRRRRQKPDHCLFGEDGREYWYGGRKDMSAPRIATVWDAIEAKTELRRTDAQFTRWPAGQQELRSHLFVRTEDFDDATTEELLAAETELQGEEEVTLQRRQNQVDWERDLGLTPAVRDSIRDRNAAVDLREVQLDRQTVVRRKPQRQRG